MTYILTPWNDDNPPPLSAENLMKIENKLFELDSKTGGGLKNWIINGMFDVWQRATTQTIAGYGSDDRWDNYHSLSTKTHSQQPFIVGQSNVPNNPKYFSRTIVTSANSAGSMVFKRQKIEDVTKLAGKTIAVSFWAKADSNKNVAINFIQEFGIGGSAKVEGIGIQKFALTNAWQRFTKIITLPSVSGKTIGADNHLELRIWFDAGSSLNALTDSLGNQSGTFDLSSISIVEGSVAVECQNQPYADVLRECQRYYVKFSNTTGSIGMMGYSLNSITAVFFRPSPVQMRKTPIFSYLGVALSDGVTSYTMTNLTLWASGVDGLGAMATASGMTAFRPLYIEFASNPSYVTFDAEL